MSGKKLPDIRRTVPPTPVTDTLRLRGELGDPNSVLVNEQVPYDTQNATPDQRGAATSQQVSGAFVTSGGLLTGGVITGAAGFPAQTFDVSAGSADFYDAYTDPDNPVYARMTWDEELLLDPIDKGVNEPNPTPDIPGISYIWIKPDTMPAPGVEEITGSVFQTSGAEPTEAQHATMILLGHANWSPALAGSGGLTGVPPRVRPGISSLQSYYTLAETRGYRAVSGGSLLTFPGTLGLSATDLVAFGPGLNWVNDRTSPHLRTISDTAARRIGQLIQSGRGDGQIVLTPAGPLGFVLHPETWDDGTGIGATVPTETPVQIMRVYSVPAVLGTNLFVFHGTMLYRTMGDAYRDLFSGKRATFGDDVRFVYLGSLIIHKDAADLEDTDFARLYDATRNPSLNAHDAPPEISGRILQHMVATPTTSDPTTSSATAALLPEMSITMTPIYAGSLMRFVFECASSHSLKDACTFVQGYVDGSPFKFELCDVAVKNNGALTLRWGGTYIPTNTDPHLFEIYWRTDGGTATATGVNRGFVVDEVSAP